VLRYGHATLQFKKVHGFPGVWNLVTGETLRFESLPKANKTTEREALLALEAGLRFEFGLIPGEAKNIVFGLIASFPIEV
jgi:hypothetical protein